MENVPILLINLTHPSDPPNTPPTFFHIHSNLLLPSSPYFKSLFDALPTPAPGQWKSLTLSEDPPPPHIFASFVQWLYYGEKHFLALEALAPKDDDNVLGGGATTIPFALKLAHLGALADRYDVAELKHAVVAEVARYWASTHLPPPAELVDYVYANTSAGSVMRRLVVEWHGVRGDDWFGSKEAKEVLARVPEFAGELAMALGMWHAKGGGRLWIERDEDVDEDEDEDEDGDGHGQGFEELKQAKDGVEVEQREDEGEKDGEDGSEESEVTLPG